MSKKELSEADIRAKFITPAIIQSGWTEDQIRRENYFTDGKILVNSFKKRGKGFFYDYILSYKNIPIAVVEAKDNNYDVGSGMQQALEYADILDLPFAFSSNGDAFLFHDKTHQSQAIEKELDLNMFPSPEDLWKMYLNYKNFTEEELIGFKSTLIGNESKMQPRYYQNIAINRSVEAIVKKQKRILLVMATGTGKTMTAFNIVNRVLKSNLKKRILFLADRTFLRDQAARSDFQSFKEKMTIIENRKIDKSRNVYLALYQGITNGEYDLFKEFSKDFFDLIVIDECHRGSASENSQWRKILDYFESATHLGLTATPKESEEISNLEYFGEPIYKYSLATGIDDGFLAPYKLYKFSLNIDRDGWMPPSGFKDKEGNIVEQKHYGIKDFDRSIIVEERRDLVAQRIQDFLISTDRYAKTIIFCVDIEHAESMRSRLVNLNKDILKENRKYIMRITGDDDFGKAELDNFVNPKERFPTIVTTSKLLSTGVDIPTCKNIILDSNIGSITEFKQIIGRGTRINEEHGKSFFNILDFRRSSNHFHDPDFDGIPEVIKKFKDDDNIEINETHYDEAEDIEKNPVKKLKVDGIEVTIINERVEYVDEKGNLKTESLRVYTKNNILKTYKDVNIFSDTWKIFEGEKKILEELNKAGIDMKDIKSLFDKDYDFFDLICHLAFDKPLLSRKQRSDMISKEKILRKYSNEIKDILEIIIDQYIEEGSSAVSNIETFKLNKFRKIGTPYEILKKIGGRDKYLEFSQAIREELYKQAS